MEDGNADVEGAAMRYHLSSFTRRVPSQADIAGKQHLLLVMLSSAQPISQHADWHSSSDSPQNNQPLFALSLKDQLPPYCVAIAAPVSGVKPACPGWLKPHQWSPPLASSKVQEAGATGGEGDEASVEGGGKGGTKGGTKGGEKGGETGGAKGGVQGGAKGGVQGVEDGSGEGGGTALAGWLSTSASAW